MKGFCSWPVLKLLPKEDIGVTSLCGGGCQLLTCAAVTSEDAPSGAGGGALELRVTLLEAINGAGSEGYDTGRQTHKAEGFVEFLAIDEAPPQILFQRGELLLVGILLVEQ
jgi:hypothetical protein